MLTLFSVKNTNSLVSLWDSQFGLQSPCHLSLMRGYKRPQGDFWNWSNGTGMTTGAFPNREQALQLASPGLRLGFLGKWQPRLPVCLADANSGKTTKELWAWVSSKSTSWGSLRPASSVFMECWWQGLFCSPQHREHLCTLGWSDSPIESPGPSGSELPTSPSPTLNSSRVC